MEHTVRLHRLSKMNSTRPVTFGVPWKPGVVHKTTDIKLYGGSGEIASSFWPTAYWPDGSIKWTAHAALIGRGDGDFSLTADSENTHEGGGSKGGLTVTEKAGAIFIDAGNLSCTIRKSGKEFINFLKHRKSLSNDNGDDRVYGENAGLSGRSYCLIRQETESGNSITSIDERCPVEIESAVVEQQCPSRCCVKLSGFHKDANGNKPFLVDLRLYFYAGSDEIKILHSIICNLPGDSNFPERQLSGLYLEFSIPMTGAPYNRFAAFAGDDGIFLEGAQGLLSKSATINDYYQKQLKPEFVQLPPEDEKTKWIIDNFDTVAIWRNFRLSQLSAKGWSITKQTLPGCQRIRAVSGKRAGGMMYVGSAAAGIAFSIRDFWQKNPMTLEADSLDREYAKARLWLWSDEARPMNFSAYDDHAHTPEITCEGSFDLCSDPIGIANTNEITLKFFNGLPPRRELLDFAEDAQKDTLLLADPRYFHDSTACGLWAMPVQDDGGVAGQIEKLIAEAQLFYLRQQEERDWYGFWNYGDVMHSYDALRHTWRYDLGGCAWQNTELAFNLWPWLQFMRTGDEETWYFARAMARHTSEVDCYHSGPLRGLGSRHNVVHWGCSCKEPRITMAFYHRLFYYLTADERIGEFMELAADVDKACARNISMMPPAYGKGKETDLVQIRTGPDWIAFVSNWLVHEERFADGKYAGKIENGLRSIAADPLGLVSGPGYDYHPEDGRMDNVQDTEKNFHMIMIFGGAEVWFELMRLFPADKRLRELFAGLGKVYLMDEGEIQKWSGGRIQDKERFTLSLWAVKMMIWAAKYYQDEKMGHKAAGILIDYARRISFGDLNSLAVKIIDPLFSPIKTEECPDLTSNQIAQFSTAWYELMELIPEYLPGCPS